MNEIANLCERLGADVDMVRKGMGSDSRIGKRFLFPGVGYGGSCFPKDVQALANSAQEYAYDFKILKAVMHVNDLQKEILSTKISLYFEGDLSGKTIGVWGLAFKPNTDDIREAPALTIISRLLHKGAKVKAYDPEAMEQALRWRVRCGSDAGACSSPGGPAGCPSIVDTRRVLQACDDAGVNPFKMTTTAWSPWSPGIGPRHGIDSPVGPEMGRREAIGLAGTPKTAQTHAR